ncbi:MAG: hypothetical protein AB1611_19185 [bacterium]
MPEQTEYFNKYLDERFKHIDESIDTLKGMFIELRQEVKQEVKQESEATRKELAEVRAEVRADNKATRQWVVGTAITVLIGFIAAAVTIFFGFSQLQTSWIQTVISFVGKTIK